MATAFDITDEVLLAFVNSNRIEMTLSELHTNLTARKIRISTDEILRIVRSESLLNLFNIQVISNNLYLIQLTPKLTLCQACLQTNCKNKMNCSKLHLCRYLPHFSNKPLDKPCSFPHKLSEHSNNMLLLRRYNYDALNEELLLELLRRHYKTNNEQFQPRNHNDSNRPSSSQADRVFSNNTQSRGPTPRAPRPRPASRPKKSPIQSTLPADNVVERQLDISIPSAKDAPEVDLEIVQLLLATKNIIIERTLETQISNEFYRRFTLQFKNKQVVDKILENESIIIYNDIPIKMKRTTRQKDTKIFTLKVGTNNKIDTIRLNLYVETLIGKVNPNIFDMTPDDNDEQIYLIRCEQPIDFIHLYKLYSAKDNLQGHHVTINEVYEAETLEVSLTQHSLHSSMIIQRLRQLFGETRWQQDVFACLCIRDQNRADIELMNAEITAKWLSEANRIERDLSLIIHPVIDFIQSVEKTEEEDEEITKLLATSKISTSLSPSDGSQKSEIDSNMYTVKDDWRIVLTHPTFGDEYRKYIREHLNISAQINGSTIQVPNEYIRKELARYTNMFMQRFIFRELSDLNKIEVKLIKDNYSRMAHKWQRDTNKTLVAARREVMDELFPRPGSTTRQQNRPVATPTFRPKQSTVPRKHEQQSTPPIVEKPIKETTSSPQNNIHTLSYPIENAVYFPFFTSTNLFPDRLGNYLSSTLNIKLDIKRVLSTKIILELSGHQKDVADARPILTNLFGSLKTKTYSDTHESCKFAIPGFYLVAQWNLDQYAIVSSCSFSSKNGGTLTIRYFADHPQFGVDEQKIDDIILNLLVSVSHQLLITSKNLLMNLEELQKKIQQRSGYGQDICCLYNQQKDSTDTSRSSSIHLCGEKSLVQQIDREVKKVIDTYTPIPCDIQLSSHQVNFLLKICSDELLKFEKQYEDDGVDLRSKLKGDTASQCLAPKYLHEKLKVFLLEMSQVQISSKDIKCSTELLNSKRRQLSDLAFRNRCLLSITLPSQATTSTQLPSSLSKIGSGTINVSCSDLITEQSEVLVICSSSKMLYDAVLRSAGSQVEQELYGKDLTKNIIDTSSGHLKQAKRLLFLPWTPPTTFINSQDLNALRESILIFIQQAIKYAVQGRFKSIAFPAIGCGGFGIPADIIATFMIDAAGEQLATNPSVQLAITFVVQQQSVYDVFQAKLKSTSTTASRDARSPSPTRLLTHDKVNITLITSNSNTDVAKKLLVTIENSLNSSSST